jgi:hypothetical protein
MQNRHEREFGTGAHMQRSPRISMTVIIDAPEIVSQRIVVIRQLVSR